MNVTRNVVKDLLPAYFSAEASEDTRALVEEYFAGDRAFERDARRAAEALDDVARIAAMPADSQIEQTALRRTKRMLRIQTLLIALASTFSLNAISLGFSFEIRDRHIIPHWMTLPGQLPVVAVLAALAVVLWAFYFRIRRRVRRNVLG